LEFLSTETKTSRIGESTATRNGNNTGIGLKERGGLPFTRPETNQKIAINDWQNSKRKESFHFYMELPVNLRQNFLGGIHMIAADDRLEIALELLFEDSLRRKFSSCRIDERAFARDNDVQVSSGLK
jgi:hypothetical protein